MSGITIGLLLIGAIIVAAVLFGLWVIALVLKFVGRGIAAMFGFGRPMEQLTRPSYPCPRNACRAVNPASARFCRRCGHELLKRQLSRQAAMW
jgi:hypothetical protein